MDLKEVKISRKNFIITAGVVGATLITGKDLFSQAKCDDVSGLKPDEIKHRQSLKYTDKSPEAGKNCKNCALFVAPKGNAPCGGCTLVKGPISPNGWCTSWVKKA